MPFLFFFVALLYSAAGFGGGSSYLALLSLTGRPLDEIASLALVCNLAAAALGTWNFSRADQMPWSTASPFLVGSIPAAFIGGAIALDGSVHLFLLAGSLTVAGIHLFLGARKEARRTVRVLTRATSWLGGLTIGAALGLLSGMVGIGGGIFLAPVLYALRWAGARQIAAICALFILGNSLSGLGGRWMRLGNVLWTGQALWLLLAVFCGAYIGSRLASRALLPVGLRLVTGLLVTVVAVRLWVQWFAT